MFFFFFFFLLSQINPLKSSFQMLISFSLDSLKIRRVNFYLSRVNIKSQLWKLEIALLSYIMYCNLQVTFTLYLRSKVTLCTKFQLQQSLNCKGFSIHQINTNLSKYRKVYVGKLITLKLSQLATRRLTR